MSKKECRPLDGLGVARGEEDGRRAVWHLEPWAWVQFGGRVGRGVRPEIRVGVGAGAAEGFTNPVYPSMVAYKEYMSALQSKTKWAAIVAPGSMTGPSPAHENLANKHELGHAPVRAHDARTILGIPPETCPVSSLDRP